MNLTIKSRKLGRDVTFSRPGSYYIFADLNGCEGTLGTQITDNKGGTISFYGDDQEAFEKTCRRWYNSLIRGD